jgi:hypothetical protein
MKKNMIIILERITTIEKRLRISKKEQEFYVMLRPKKCFILDASGTSIGCIVKGKPTERDYLGGWAQAYGPFSTRSEAQLFLDERLKEIRKRDPQRFVWLESLSVNVKS